MSGAWEGEVEKGGIVEGDDGFFPFGFGGSCSKGGKGVGL